MHNIRKIGIRILLIIVVVSLYQMLVEFVYRPYHEVVIQQNIERSQVEGTIETLLCGTSTAQRGFDPEVIDKELETVSFNMGTSLQPLDGTYHLIKEVAASNPIETVFLTMAPDTMRRKVVASKYKGYVYDRMHNVGNKIEYLVDACDVEEWPYVTWYSTRVDNYFDFNVIKENVSTKLQPDYETGKYCDEFYRGKGLLSLDKSFKGKKNPKNKRTREFDSNSMVAENVEYLKKIAEYCKENKIELIFVYAPLSRNEVIRYKDFNQVHNYFVALAEEFGVKFWDFNYYKDADKLFSNETFQDLKHLNVKGAKLFSEELAKVYNVYHNGQDESELFTEDYAYNKE